MVEGLEEFMVGSDEPGISELGALLHDIMGRQPRAWRFVEREPLKASSRNVQRLRFARDGQMLSVVIKRVSLEVARRNELVTQRWLPAVGLGEYCAQLLGSAAARSGACVWQVYEDLGPWELAPRAVDPDAVRAAVELIARLHVGFANHALLGEVRMHGGDRGIHFYEMNVRDAICAMAAVRPPANQRPLCDRVLKRLDRLLNEIPVRAQALAEHGGPQTLLHGDLWAINVFVMPGASGPAARLIDWDHAAAGPLSYDLSTFLLRFHSTARAGVLALYAESLGRAGWQLPAARDLNLLFETAELARYANRIIWPAIALAHEGTEWGFQELKEVEEWFENLAPVLAIEPSAQPEPVLP